MQDVLRRMQLEHRRYRLLLEYLVSSIDAFETGEPLDWDDLDVLMDYLRPGLAGLHFHEEHQLWQRLSLRHDGPHLIIAALRSLQKQTAASACKLDDAIRSARHGRPMAVDRFLPLARGFAAAMQRQIALEERALFPFAEVVPNGTSSHRSRPACHGFGSSRSRLP